MQSSLYEVELSLYVNLQGELNCALVCVCVCQPSFFVVYNMVSTEVLAVFENTSDQLLELFENFCDLFRNATLHSEAVQFPCSASSNNYARQVQRR